MKKILFALILGAAAMSCNAQDITLPAPDMKQKSMTMVEALATRHSVREYANKELNLQEISNLCWAACGVTRDNEHRTAPSAMNRKEIRLYVFLNDGTYEYKAVENKLALVANGDNRKLVAAGQAFAATAPVCLVMVMDLDRLGGKNERSVMMACVDAGNVSENINLYCQAAGLCTVPRATMDIKGISTLLKLSENQMPIMNNPVGFPKE